MSGAKFALVLWLDCRTSSVVPVKSVKSGELCEGSRCEVVWNKKKYVARIVKLGEKEELEKCDVDVTGQIIDPRRGPQSSASVAEKRDVQEGKRKAADKQKVSKQRMEMEILEKMGLAPQESDADDPAVLSSPGTSAPPQPGEPIQTPPTSTLQIRSPESSSTNQCQVLQTSANQSTSSNFHTPAHHEQNTLPLPTSSVTEQAPAAPSNACACVFCTDLAPFVTEENVGFLDRVVSCMKISLLKKGPLAGEPSNISRPESYPSSFPFRGAVELIPGSRVWISRSTRDIITSRNTEHPKEMLRQLLKVCVGEENIIKCSARGQGGYQAVPPPIVDAVTVYVESKCQQKLDVTKLINNLCTGMRRTQTSDSSASRPVKRKLKKPDDSLSPATQDIQPSPSSSTAPPASIPKTPHSSPLPPKRTSPMVLRSASKAQEDERENASQTTAAKRALNFPENQSAQNYSPYPCPQNVEPYPLHHHTYSPQNQGYPPHHHDYPPQNYHPLPNPGYPPYQQHYAPYNPEYHLNYPSQGHQGPSNPQNYQEL